MMRLGLAREVISPPRRGWRACGAASIVVVIGAIGALELGPPTPAAPVVAAAQVCEDVPALGVCVAAGPDGAVVIGVLQDSPAGELGMKTADLIEEVDCIEVRDAAQLRAALDRPEARGRRRIKHVRGGVAISYRRVTLKHH